MKKIMMLALVFGVTSPLYANCGNDSGNGNGCSNNGTGPQGQPGVNGNNGKPGVNGKDGKDGKDTSYQFRGTDLAGDFAVRLLDMQYLQVQAFDSYVFGSEPSQDVFGAGHNQTIGARIVIKLGKSYEERLLEKQAAQIKALEAALSRVQ